MFLSGPGVYWVLMIAADQMRAQHRPLSPAQLLRTTNRPLLSYISVKKKVKYVGS